MGWKPTQKIMFCVNLGKMYENLRKIALCALILQKWRSKSKYRRFFFWEVMFLQFFSGKLGEIWASLEEIWAKMVLEVL